MTERRKPTRNDDYWFIKDYAEEGETWWNDDDVDRARFDCGNCFRTEEEAEAAAEKVKALLLDLHKNPEKLKKSEEPSQKLGTSDVVTTQKTPVSDSSDSEQYKKRGFLIPSHYDISPEPIEVIKKWKLGFCLGNVVKYIARAGRKAGESRDSDLHKAMEYLRLELEDE